MTLGTKRSRLITVDGVRYRWKVRHRPTYSQANDWTPLTFAVERAEDPGCVLVVSMPSAHPGNWMLMPSIAIRPAVVATSVRNAIVRGWVPVHKGPVFSLALTDEDVVSADDQDH
jgi:hypothetical protein